MRRSGFFLSLAAGLVASLALSAPTQAGTIFDVEAEVIVAKGTATSVIVDFSPGPITGPITILSSTNVPGLTTGSVASSTTVQFDGLTAGVGIYDLEFTVMGPAGLLGLGGTIHGTTAQGGVAVLDVTAAVPEPTSVALLGVGMAGFFAFRRMFKRPATA
jgi:hypothetical protein